MNIPSDIIVLIIEYLIPTLDDIMDSLNISKDNTYIPFNQCLLNICKDDDIYIPYNLCLVNKRFMQIVNNAPVLKRIDEHFRGIPKDEDDIDSDQEDPVFIYFNHTKLHINGSVQIDYDVFKENSEFNKIGFLHHCNDLKLNKSNYNDNVDFVKRFVNGENECLQELVNATQIKCLESFVYEAGDEMFIYRNIFNIGKYVITSVPYNEFWTDGHTFGNWNIYISGKIICFFTSTKDGWKKIYRSKLSNTQLLNEILNDIGIDNFEDRIEKFIMLIGFIEYYKIRILNLIFHDMHETYDQNRSDLSKKALDKYRNLFVKKK